MTGSDWGVQHPPGDCFFDQHTWLHAQKMSAGKLYLVLQMVTFLQPKFLKGEDLSAESCTKVGGREIVVQS